ncbi:MAG: porin [Bacteroidales bacterium]|jgi:hypothetical protein
MRKILTVLLLLALILPTISRSQDTYPKIRLKFDTRFDFETRVPSNKNLSTLSSIDGKYLNIILDGSINEKFSYNYRQRMILNGIDGYKSFFNATDWIYLTYKMNDNFSLSGGKQVVAIGGYEYDAAPIDQYFWSNFWNNVVCYQFGGSLNYKTNNEKHNIGFQITNSPFTNKSMGGIYSYNLIWYGNMNWFNTIYSVNMVEYEKGHFINYIALGNKFNVGKFSLELDLMNRASGEQDNFFADYSLIGNLIYNVNSKLKIFGKAGHDENKAQQIGYNFAYDRFVLPGTEYNFCGLGVEYFPIKNSKDVRLHAYWATNNNEIKYNTFNIGLRWQMKVLER